MVLIWAAMAAKTCFYANVSIVYSISLSLPLGKRKAIASDILKAVETYRVIPASQLLYGFEERYRGCNVWS